MIRMYDRSIRIDLRGPSARGIRLRRVVEQLPRTKSLLRALGYRALSFSKSKCLNTMWIYFLLPRSIYFSIEHCYIILHVYIFYFCVCANLRENWRWKVLQTLLRLHKYFLANKCQISRFYEYEMKSKTGISKL